MLIISMNMPLSHKNKYVYYLKTLNIVQGRTILGTTKLSTIIDFIYHILYTYIF